MEYTKQIAADQTVKYLFFTSDKSRIEAVFIPQKRTQVICLSSQVGCALKCSFCATGALGFKRNLTHEEIILQYDLIVQDQGLKELPNIVFMGMGEPLLNMQEVSKAITYFHKKGLAKKKMTLSTVGILHAFEAASKTGVNLALSLHAPTDDLRRKLIPLAQQSTIDELFQACSVFSFRKHKPLMIEYVLIKGVNDQEEHMDQLIHVLRKHPFPYVINFIPYNPHAFAHFLRSERAQFCKEYLLRAGFKTFLREPRGEDISAACGMLVGTSQLHILS